MTKIMPKSVKIGAWTGPGGSWERAWESFWVPRLPATAKSGQAAKFAPPSGAHLGPLLHPKLIKVNEQIRKILHNIQTLKK